MAPTPARPRARLLVAAALPLAGALAEQLEAHGHRVLLATTPAEVARLLEAMHAGRIRPADFLVLQGNLLTERAHEALCGLRIRDRSMVLMVLAGENDSTGRGFASRLRAAIVLDPVQRRDVDFIAKFADRRRAA